MQEVRRTRQNKPGEYTDKSDEAERLVWQKSERLLAF